VLDREGHGTHTASTAAGRAVAGASLGGLAGGTARGAVPGARLAVYKVCWEEGCSSEDILAAFDDAIADGVDVISASLGSGIAFDYAADPMAIGAFHAMRRGVVVSVSAGNSGPTLGSVSNVAPWSISVAATLTDRRIISELVLGNGRRVVGNAITVFPNLGKPSLLMDPGGCDHEQLDGKRYKGAVLLCGEGAYISSEAISRTGADGAIVYMFADEDKDTAFSFAIPIVVVMQKEFNHIIDYYNSTRSAAAGAGQPWPATITLLSTSRERLALTCAYDLFAAATPWPP
jgi:subtilisin family serine protease